MAEKLTWRYEDVEPDPAEALKLFQQSADLGFSDALIRIGQLQQQGKGTARDPSAALETYLTAAKAVNFVALAFLAKLLSQTRHLEKANALWNRFFAKLDATLSMSSMWPDEANCCTTTSPLSLSWDLSPVIWKCFDGIGSRSRPTTSGS